MNLTLRNLRHDALLTQKQLAARSGVALRTYSSVERGHNCRMDTKRKILIALGIPFERKAEVFAR